MTSLEEMPTMADGITAKRWWWRVSIYDPPFHDLYIINAHSHKKKKKKKLVCSYVYEASDMNLPQIPITMQVFRII
jgi:uncharacterized membrane protein